jgi:hypothetical protein
MLAVRGRGGIAPTHYLHQMRWGEWSASRPGRTLLPGKGPPVLIGYEAGWASELVMTQRRGKILCRGVNPCLRVCNHTLAYIDRATQAHSIIR